MPIVFSVHRLCLKPHRMKENGYHGRQYARHNKSKIQDCSLTDQVRLHSTRPNCCS